MQTFRFQPPGCNIWVIGLEDGPQAGRFRWDRDSEGRPCRPELLVDLQMERGEIFRLALEYEERWKWVLADFEERCRREEHERQRAEEAASRWDEIRGQWEATKRRVQDKQRDRPLSVTAPLRQPPACILALGLAWPCTEDQIKRAFREKAKELHPDRGGPQEAFVALRHAYEEALRLVAG